MAIKIGIVGIGAIARSQHLPVLAESKQFELVAAASRTAKVDGVKNFSSLTQMLEEAPEVDAVSLCTPPLFRVADARAAIRTGRHVMLEKPPAPTLSDAYDLVEFAKSAGVTLFATWHSRYAPAVEPARAWVRDRTVRSVQVEWREDVRVWHPGQEWIFAAGGMGIFDPGINALSILTHILPNPFALRSGRLDYPLGRQAPIAAELAFEDRTGAPIRASLDFLQTGEQTWTIKIDTDRGSLELSQGGAILRIDGAVIGADRAPPLHGEYTALYERFADLIASGESDADLSPLQHVADAFMLAERAAVAPFEF